MSMGVAPSETGRASGAERHLLALGTVLVAAAQLVGANSPSFWYDEGASVSAARRSLTSLLAMFENVDAVHGAYYLMLNAVRRVFGSSELAMRAPSAIAVAATGLVVYLIARRFTSATFAAAAAMLCVALPRFTWAATEARSFAVSTFLITLTTLVFLCALRDARRRWLILYGALCVVSVLIYMHTALVVVAHAVALVWTRVPRRRRVALFGVMVLAGMASLPFVAFVMGHHATLGGTQRIDAGTVRDVLVEQFFPGEPVAASLCWATLTIASLAAAIRARRPEPSHAEATDPISPFALLLPWLAIPTVALVGYSAAAGESIYQPRALTMSAPALSLLIAFLLSRVLRAIPAWSIVLILVVAMIPGWAAAREATAKGTDWRQVAQELARESAPGDAVLYLGPETVNSYPALIGIIYPEEAGHLNDPALVEAALDRPYLFDHRLPLDEVALPEGTEAVQLVRSHELAADTVEAAERWLGEHGFRLISSTSLPLTSVDRYAASD